MIPSFVVTLREGVEASLIIGIVAAFLVRQGRPDAMRQVWIGVAAAVALCVAVGVGLRIVGSELPEAQQEGLATIVALVAVAAITYMIVWMRRNARGIKGALEGETAAALAKGSATALVAMAFLAVLREGFETSVFLLAVFDDATNPAAAAIGAVLGLVAAVAIGIGLYRGGVKLNLTRFFRITGVILVFVAAGLLASAAHTAEEAGWITGLQSQAVDLSWLVKEDTITGSLLTGMLGLRPEPTVMETLLYVLYAVPMTIYVLWPAGRREKRSRQAPERGAAPVQSPA